MAEVSRCIALSTVPPVQGLRAQIARKLHKRGVIEIESVGSGEEEVVVAFVRRLDEAQALKTSLDGRKIKRLRGAQLRVTFAPESMLSYLRLASSSAATNPTPRLESFCVAPRQYGELVSMRVSVRGASNADAHSTSSHTPLPPDSIYDSPPTLLSSVPALSSSSASVTLAQSTISSSSSSSVTRNSAFTSPVPRTPGGAAPPSPKSPSIMRPTQSSPLLTSLGFNRQRF